MSGELSRALVELAETAATFADGDACVRLSPRGEGDDYDVDADAFNCLKRTLLLAGRLAEKRLGAAAPGTGVWMMRGGRAELVVAGSPSPEQFAGWNSYSVEPPPAMREAFAGKPGVAADEARGLVSAFAPVRDSLGQVAAVIEFCARLA